MEVPARRPTHGRAPRDLLTVSISGMLTADAHRLEQWQDPQYPGQHCPRGTSQPHNDPPFSAAAWVPSPRVAIKDLHHDFCLPFVCGFCQALVPHLGRQMRGLDSRHTKGVREHRYLLIPVQRRRSVVIPATSAPLAIFLPGSLRRRGPCSEPSPGRQGTPISIHGTEGGEYIFAPYVQDMPTKPGTSATPEQKAQTPQSCLLECRRSQHSHLPRGIAVGAAGGAGAPTS